MSNMVECPNCKQKVTSDSEFCIFCGAKMPAAHSPASGAGVPGGSGRIRRCRNGHEFADDSLVYCPICGLPFEGSSSGPGTETWRCSCGHENPIDNNFCEECSRPKEPKPPRPREDKPSKSETAFIPEGMYIPTPDDLKPKRGNKA